MFILAIIVNDNYNNTNETMAIHTHMEVVSFFSLYFNFKIKEVET